MALKLSDALRNGMADAFTTAVGNAGTVKIYTGTRPATGGGALSGNTLLGTLTGGSPFAPAASGGVLTPNAVTQDSSADATGTATWYRVATSGGTWVMDGDCGTSGTDMVLNTTSIVSGGPISVASWTITMPNAA